MLSTWTRIIYSGKNYKIDIAFLEYTVFWGPVDVLTWTAYNSFKYIFTLQKSKPNTIELENIQDIYFDYYFKNMPTKNLTAHVIGFKELRLHFLTLTFTQRHVTEKKKKKYKKKIITNYLAYILILVA